jgi:predicted metal-dependent hydrolase
VGTTELSPLPVRDLGFEFPDDLPLAWHRTVPELAFAANSISLLMPYVEPYIVRSIRRTLDDLDEPLRTRTEAYVAQELSHHVQHRHFNDVLAQQCPAIRRLERWMHRTYRWLGRSRSSSFNVAFSAGSETIAFCIARWVDENLRTIFDDADDDVTRLYLWHLAEEVEHKTAAYDVFEATDGSRLRYAAATATSLALLIVFTFAGSVLQLRSSRRLWNPVAWFRMTRWSLSLAFSMLPTLAVSCLKGHDPRMLTDPLYLTQWLRGVTREPATPAT